MQRLDDQDALAFATRSGASALLFGHPTGRITSLQAAAFADVWAEHAGQARFGYVDALESPAARDAFMVRALPTILVFRDGDLVEVLEGFQPRERIAAALDGDRRPEPASRQPARRPGDAARVAPLFEGAR